MDTRKLVNHGGTAAGGAALQPQGHHSVHDSLRWMFPLPSGTNVPPAVQFLRGTTAAALWGTRRSTALYQFVCYECSFGPMGCHILQLLITVVLSDILASNVQLLVFNYVSVPWDMAHSPFVQLLTHSVFFNLYLKHLTVSSFIISEYSIWVC